MTTRRSFIGGSAAAVIAGAAPRTAWGRTQVDVAIIGAGLAGLHAAKLCEQAGLDVVVLEAENRVGGRLHTLDDLPGAPDAGGIQIGVGYSRLHSIAGELGVTLSSNTGTGAGRRQAAGNLYWVNGERSTAEKWDAEPARLLRKYASVFCQLSPASDWMNADPELDVSVEPVLRQAGASREELRLIQANFNGNSLAGMSHASSSAQLCNLPRWCQASVDSSWRRAKTS